MPDLHFPNLAHPFDRHMVKERAESLVLISLRCLPHTLQRTAHTHSPALRPGHGLLARVLLVKLHPSHIVARSDTNTTGRLF